MCHLLAEPTNPRGRHHGLREGLPTPEYEPHFRRVQMWGAANKARDLTRMLEVLPGPGWWGAPSLRPEFLCRPFQLIIMC